MDKPQEQLQPGLPEEPNDEAAKEQQSSSALDIATDAVDAAASLVDAGDALKAVGSAIGAVFSIFE